ncbi:MAG: 5'-methylthioadenosine/adenosylhomocysteine nucleosidase [Burkholderiaceae bacterium]|nr:MAG: 5'-methylthioadenosine/adenosylhomocysteine nucleosidase [Burkholderiaceae bacterium]TBR77127.1 MAG: 5'-methylthioadenosine/adenosylhomocysteine nucleosidase [Burkholderiaceae bacterium]
MSRIAILSALAQEQHGLLALLLQPQKVQRAGRDFWLGHLHGHSVVLALSRIGKVAAATTATALIEHLAVTRILFTGVAGGLAPDVQVGDVVVASSFVQHDLDASPIFPRFELPLYGRAVLACDEILSALLFQAARDHLAEASAAAPARHRVHRGLIASGDRFVSAQAQSVTLRRALQRAGHKALAVEMEGAAVAQVCLDYGVPFAAVRTISDRADDQAHLDFATFVREVASQYACAIIGRALRSLSNK